MIFCRNCRDTFHYGRSRRNLIIGKTLSAQAGCSRRMICRSSNEYHDKKKWDFEQIHKANIPDLSPYFACNESDKVTVFVLV
jgi:hypothetical protein